MIEEIFLLNGNDRGVFAEHICDRLIDRAWMITKIGDFGSKMECRRDTLVYDDNMERISSHRLDFCYFDWSSKKENAFYKLTKHAAFIEAKWNIETGDQNQQDIMKRACEEYESEKSIMVAFFTLHADGYKGMFRKYTALDNPICKNKLLLINGDLIGKELL